MSRLHDKLDRLRKNNRKALITFITAGDPNPEVTVPALLGLVAGGADVLELGLPFSDPEADGPAIQASSERALAHQVTLSQVLDMVSGFRSHDDTTPVVLMGYLNPILAMGAGAFAKQAHASGVDGLIMVNLPPEEAGEIAPLLKTHGIDLIYLVAPTTTVERMRFIAERAQGFVYYVALKGTTGADHIEVGSVTDKVTALKQATNLPVMVGFGIKDGQSAKAAARSADGVVVGSVLVSIMGAGDDTDTIPQRLSSCVTEIREALDS
ncbi:MAG: tryptophan synthase subunit alpha [Gammaproteobacteria bacterium]|nr:tryptophan synthase subunit alpha [Gammaproteobacteria bacterium]